MNELVKWELKEDVFKFYFLDGDIHSIPKESITEYRRVSNFFCIFSEDNEYFFETNNEEEASIIENILKYRK